MPKSVYRALAAFIFGAFGLAGQSPARNWTTVTTLAPGTDVRVEVSGQSATRGRLERVTDDSVVLTTAQSQQTFSRQQIVRISQRKNGHRVRNALIGAGIGAGAGLGIGLAAGRCTQLCIVSPGLIRGSLAGAGAVVGAFVGVVLPSGGWKEVYKQ